MGGACAAIISIVELKNHGGSGVLETVTIMAGLLIGGVSFAGSMIAFGKLNGNINDKKCSRSIIPEHGINDCAPCFRRIYLRTG